MKSRLILFGIAILLWTACERKEGELNGEPNQELRIASVDITDASALFSTAIEKEPVSRSLSEEQLSRLFKINTQGEVKEVSFTGKNKERLKVDIGYLRKISDELIVVKVSMMREETEKEPDSYPEQYETFLLIRKKDGAVFDLRQEGYSILENLKYKPYTLLIDKSNHMYWTYWSRSDAKDIIYRMSPFEDTDLKATPVSGDIKLIRYSYIDSQDVILIDADDKLIFRFPDGTFMEYEDVEIVNHLGYYILPIQKSPEGGFIVLENKIDSTCRTNIIKIIPDKTSQTVSRTDLGTIEHNCDVFAWNDLPDGGYILHQNNYKTHIHVDAYGKVETKTYETGFDYEDAIHSNNCVYGLEGTTIYRMDLTTRHIEQVFSDSRYRFDTYAVAPDDSYIEIIGYKYSSSRMVVLRIAGGQIIAENEQTENSTEVLSFIQFGR